MYTQYNIYVYGSWCSGIVTQCEENLLSVLSDTKCTLYPIEIMMFHDNYGITNQHTRGATSRI